MLQQLRKQCQQFAVDLLDQTRSSKELAIILSHYDDTDCVCDVRDDERAIAVTKADGQEEEDAVVEAAIGSSRTNATITASAGGDKANALRTHAYVMSSDEIVKLPLLRLAIKYRQKKV